jgi:hypothetical protein
MTDTTSRDRTPDLEAIDRPEVEHEESDVNIRAIFTFGGVLVAVAVVIHLAVWGLFAYFDAREATAVRQYPLATDEARLPPEPRLQVAPRLDLEALRTAEDALLNGYHWVNRDAGIVRIPIEEAMRLTVERGLPVLKGAGEQPNKSGEQTK